MASIGFLWVLKKMMSKINYIFQWRKYFITNFKAFVKIKTEIENGMTMTNLHKYQIFVQKLSIKMKKV